MHDRLGRAHYMVGNMDEAIIHHQKAIDLFGEVGDDARLARACLDLGSVYFNALCESLFATLECELIDRRRFPTQSEARSARATPRFEVT